MYQGKTLWDPRISVINGSETYNKIYHNKMSLSISLKGLSNDKVLS